MKEIKENPTRDGVDSLAEKGLTIKQIAGIYQCSEYKIAKLKTKKPQGDRPDSAYRNPIKPGEIAEARKIKHGHKVRILNMRKMREGEGIHWGVWEEHEVVAKYPHIAVLDNGMSVSYAEIVMQTREGKGN